MVVVRDAEYAAIHGPVDYQDVLAIGHYTSVDRCMKTYAQ